MSLKRSITAAFATIGLAAGGVVAAAPAASADDMDAHVSLAEVLLADGDDFDRNPFDYDIVTQAVLAVLDAKPESPVKVLLDGKTPVTAFIPTDYAFRALVRDLDRFYFSEKRVFDAVAGLGIDTVETVLLYHVIPGATIDKEIARGADGAALGTALSLDMGASQETFEVDVLSERRPIIRLIDNDPNDRNPFIVKFDINEGNPQIAHGISQVLRFTDL